MDQSLFLTLSKLLKPAPRVTTGTNTNDGIGINGSGGETDKGYTDIHNAGDVANGGV